MNAEPVATRTSTQTPQWLVQDLAIGFKQHRLIAHINLTLSLGDRLAISGPNGSGKSCLLKTMAGIIPELDGAISAPEYFSHALMGVVPQVTDFQPRLPVSLKEMVALGVCASMQRASKANIQAALDAVGLSIKQSKQVWQRSSGGERQRALIARALIRQPQVLLLDEASSHLDPDSAQRIFSMLRQRCEEKTMLFIAVIHDERIAEQFCAQRLHLANGTATLTDINNDE